MADRGDVEIHIGGRARTIRFRVEETVELEERLGMDVMAYLGKQGSSLKFLAHALVCGLMHTDDPELTHKRAMAWLNDFEGDLDDLQRTVIFSIAKGQPKQKAQRMVKALEAAFAKSGAAASPLESKGPTSPGISPLV